MDWRKPIRHMSDYLAILGDLLTTGSASHHGEVWSYEIAGGSQPMSNEDGSVWVVVNGEIYNHRELGRRLAAQGHVCRTRSDTESIVHAWEVR